MKKECMELFKEYRVEGEMIIYDEKGTIIQVIHSATIEEIADEIVEILNHIDRCVYESDCISMKFVAPNKNDIMEVLILNEVNNLMAGTKYYNEEDSRTHLYSEIIECTSFMAQHKSVEKMIIAHNETFLCDDAFTITISDVFNKRTFSIEIMDCHYDIDDADNEQEWEEIWHHIYKEMIV